MAQKKPLGVKLYKVKWTCQNCDKRYEDIIDDYELFNAREYCRDCGGAMMLLDIHKVVDI